MAQPGQERPSGTSAGGSRAYDMAMAIQEAAMHQEASKASVTSAEQDYDIDVGNLASIIRMRQSQSNEPFAVSKYRTFSEEASQTYADVKASWRFRLIEPSTLVIQAMCAAGFILWGLYFVANPPGVHLTQLFVSIAYAAETPAAGFDIKPLMYFAIFVALLVAFLTSLYVQYFSKSTKAQDSAGTVSKLLLGFFVGAMTKYLGA